MKLTVALLASFVMALSLTSCVDRPTPDDETGAGGANAPEAPPRGPIEPGTDRPKVTPPTPEIVAWHKAETDRRIQQIQSDELSSAAQKNAAIDGLRKTHEACKGDVSKCR